MMKTILFAFLVAFAAFQLQSFLFGGNKVTDIKNLNDTYDYIIIGAGSAGSVVASRLSEDPEKTILVLEAGGEESTPFYSHIPAAAPFLAGSVYDWAYKTEPQTESCHEMNNRQSFWPRGKGLGGTSILNWMCYVRGHPADFDHWAALGNKGWSYKDVLPYFTKSETTEIDEFKNSPVHGHEGPLHMSNTKICEACDLMQHAAKEMGLDEVNDGVGHETGGFSWLHFFSHKGVRQSVAKKYLRPAMGRKNLHVLTNAHVTRILFTTMNEQINSNGVEFLHGEKIYQVKAAKEVILSAGAVNSPQILLLSGIGPENHLKEHKIPVVLNSPAVGKHLEDHVAATIVYSINETAKTDYDGTVSLLKLIRTLPQYALFGSGPLSIPPLGLVGHFYSGLPSKHPGPDLQLYISPGDSYHHRENFFNYKKDTLQLFDRAPEDTSGISLLVCVLHPESRGEIKLKSSNPLDHPSIDPRYMDNDKDDKVLASGLRMFINLMKTNAMAKYDPKLLERPMPGCNSYQFLSDEYLTCISKRRAFTLYHPTGTCRMGGSIVDSVVDSHLRVHGVRGLRVVDASVFPTITSGNTNAPTIMVAEKASDLIKNEKY